MDLELAKDLYEFEWELREKLTDWLQTPITTLTVLAAAIAYLFQEAAFYSDTRAAFFYASLFFAAGAWIYGAYSVARSFWGFRYEKLARLSSINAHYEKLQDYYAKYPTGGTDSNKEFAKYLIKRLAEATDSNALNNIKKSFWLHQAGGATVATLVTTGIAGLQFLLLQ